MHHHHHYHGRLHDSIVAHFFNFMLYLPRSGCMWGGGGGVAVVPIQSLLFSLLQRKSTYIYFAFVLPVTLTHYTTNRIVVAYAFSFYCCCYTTTTEPLLYCWCCCYIRRTKRILVNIKRFQLLHHY